MGGPLEAVAGPYFRDLAFVDNGAHNGAGFGGDVIAGWGWPGREIMEGDVDNLSRGYPDVPGALGTALAVLLRHIAGKVSTGRKAG